MINNPITSTYDPATNRVTMTCGIGLLTCVSSVPLEVYEKRAVAWPGIYSDTLLIEKA